MRKLLSLLFTFVIAFSLAMPVFAQDTGSQEAPKTEKKTKKTKATKTKKAKKTTSAAPTQ
jgi:hypothetical protein